MEIDNLLNQLLEDIKKSSNIKMDYSISEKQISDEEVWCVSSKYKEEINYKRDILEKHIKYPFSLDDLELLNEYINCDVCSAYTLIEKMRKLIEGYIDSTIAICKIDKNLYKIDATLLQIDPISSIKYETNMQCNMRLIFD